MAGAQGTWWAERSPRAAFESSSRTLVVLGARSIGLLLLVPAALGVGLAATAQDRRHARGLPSLTGRVHRLSYQGCGQAWSMTESWSDVRLDVDRRGGARLVVAAKIRHESGGARRLLGGGGPYRTLRDETRRLRWSGRATHDASGLRMRLRSLEETVERHGADAETIIGPTTTREAAALGCTLETHDIFPAARTDPLPEAPVARRALYACRFANEPGTTLPPRLLFEIATAPIFLATGAGITTDAAYGPYVRASPDVLVARAPGGLAAPF